MGALVSAPTGSSSAGAANDRATQPALTQNAFVAMVVLLAASAATARGIPNAEGAAEALLRALWDNKVLWLCLGVGLWHLLQTPSAELGATGLIAAAPALLLSAAGGGVWPWLGLIPLLLLGLSSAGSGARTGSLIVLLAAAHEIAVSFLGVLGGDALLGIDARIAGSISSWFLPDISVEGTALQRDGGHMLVLVWGCSSLSNLGDALLLFCALVSLYGPSHLPGNARGRFLVCMLLVAVATIALNATRLGLMAGSAEAYAYLHGSSGAAWFRIATLCFTAALGWVAVRR
jgi:hypothetical protein